MRSSHTLRPVFDDPNLVSAAGLAPVMRLAENAGLHAGLERLTVECPNPAVKAAGIIGGMLAGADSITDLDLLRSGGMDRVFTGLRAPSTYGTFLRSFTHGHVRQLGAVNTSVLAGLTTMVPAVLPAGPGSLTFFDADDSVIEVHGYAKQGAAYGYSGVKGLNLHAVAVSTPDTTPSSPTRP